ncbi:MAG: hypothetical protein QOG52_1474 [Frankiaceae bacterium]|nr:hypothetical protein [Frankiaceae bacterium]
MWSAGPVGTGAFRDVNNLSRSTPWLHGTALAIATYGIAVLIGLAVVSALVCRSRGDSRGVAASVWSAAAALLALWVNQPISHLVGERRPFVSLPDVLVLMPHGTDFGFASDHAILAGAIAAGLWFANRRWGILAAVCALVIAFSRTYVGVHFPQDVVGGLLIGAVVAVVGWVLLGARLTALVERLASGRAAMLVRGNGSRLPERQVS